MHNMAKFAMFIKIYKILNDPIFDFYVDKVVYT